MRTTERLRGLKAWITRELCEGREMKAAGKNMDLGEIRRVQPCCFLGFAPSRLNENRRYQEDVEAICPGILIMPTLSNAHYAEEKRFDRYNNIHRPQEVGQHLAVTILFGVYEPGTRLPGFVDSVGEKGQGMDTSLLLEGTEEGLFTLFNWMDDCKEKLIGQRMIPGTDLAVDQESITYSLYTDQNYVVDKRPLYFGYLNVTFDCHADEGTRPAVQAFLE